MIVDAFLSVIIWLSNSLQSLIPSWAWASPSVDPLGLGQLHSPGQAWTGGSAIRQWMLWVAGWNDILPVSEMVTILGLVITWVGVLMAIRSGRWIIGVVRGSGTS